MMQFKCNSAIEYINLFLDKVEQEGKKQLLDEEQQFKLRLAIEELLLNSVNHAIKYKAQDKMVEIFITKDKVVQIKFIEYAKPFNPLEYYATLKNDIADKIEQYEEGGLGLHLISNLTNNLSYSYDNELKANIIEFEL